MILYLKRNYWIKYIIPLLFVIMILNSCRMTNRVIYNSIDQQLRYNRKDSILYIALEEEYTGKITDSIPLIFNTNQEIFEYYMDNELLFTYNPRNLLDTMIITHYLGDIELLDSLIYVGKPSKNIPYQLADGKLKSDCIIKMPNDCNIGASKTQLLEFLSTDINNQFYKQYREINSIILFLNKYRRSTNEAVQENQYSFNTLIFKTCNDSIISINFKRY